jgi:hypothetical protein
MNANAEKIAIPAAMRELPSAASMASAPDIDSKEVRSRFENPITQVIGTFAFQLETRFGVSDLRPRPNRTAKHDGAGPTDVALDLLLALEPIP